MDWAAIAIGVVVLVFGLPFIIGAIYPARSLAATYVRKRLIHFRMNPSLFPIEELAVFALNGAKRQARLRGGRFRHHLRQSAETTAWLVVSIATGEPHDWSAAEIKAGAARGMPDVVWGILAKHDPRRFGLEELEKTQLANAVVLEAVRSEAGKIARAIAVMFALLAIGSPACASEHRSRTVTAEFQRENPCPSTGKTAGACPGFIKDHVVPLCAGGADAVPNMQWQIIGDAKAKDRWEREWCEELRR